MRALEDPEGLEMLTALVNSGASINAPTAVSVWSIVGFVCMCVCVCVCVCVCMCVPLYRHANSYGETQLVPVLNHHKS